MRMRQQFGGQKDVETYDFKWQEKVFSQVRHDCTKINQQEQAIVVFFFTSILIFMMHLNVVFLFQREINMYSDSANCHTVLERKYHEDTTLLK